MVATSDRPGTDAVTPRAAAEARYQRGNLLFFVGCLVCGTVILGAIGAVILLVGIRMIRQAQRAGVRVRPWALTIVGGVILMDSSVNYLAWGIDLFWSHDTLIGRTFFVNYGHIGDGAYVVFHNAGAMGGTYIGAEKALMIAMIAIIFPMRIAAAWGLLNMEYWGLRWSIIANWLYFAIWLTYAAHMALNFPLRFGLSDFGVLGWVLMSYLPFMGPIVLLPLLHTLDTSRFKGKLVQERHAPAT